MRRLEAITSLVPHCDTFADIGCDHGYISRFVLENGLAKRVIAADISEKCLKKARLLLAEYDNVQYACTDGLKGIDADVIVIAGMGGLTILQILRAKENLDSMLILQPQDHCGEVRQYLIESGYRLERDFVAKENNKFYDIMQASRGEQTLDSFQLELGAYYDSDEQANAESRQLLIERLQREYRKFSSFSDGGKNEHKRAFLKEALKRLGA